jgi:hypothetical protein
MPSLKFLNIFFKLGLVEIGMILVGFIVSFSIFHIVTYQFIVHNFPEPVDANLTDWQYASRTMEEFDATIASFPYQAPPERTKEIRSLQLAAKPGMKIDPDTYALYIDDETLLPIVKGVTDEPFFPDVVQGQCPMKISDPCYGWTFKYYAYKHEKGLANEKYDQALIIYLDRYGTIEQVIWDGPEADKSCSLLEQDIYGLLEDMRYCTQDSDCYVDTELVLGCPFGCDMIASRLHDDGEVRSQLEENALEYGSRCLPCVYDCDLPPTQQDLACTNNRCEDMRYYSDVTPDTTGAFEPTNDLLLDPDEFYFINNLEIGMTKSEVEDLVDEPHEVLHVNRLACSDWTVWRYVWDVRGQGAWAEIYFENGAVVALLGNVFNVEQDVRDENECSDIQAGLPSMADDLEIRKVFEQYIAGGAICDIDGAYELISEASKDIVHFTCQNYQAETRCYENRDMAVRVTGDTGVIYRVPFSHQVENPVFFVRENGEWKIAFSKMAFGMAMSGSTCDSGWSWTNEKLPAEFRGYFPEGECPD